MKHRLERVGELLKREIGEVIRRELPIDQAGLITVNEVRVTNDLHHATVFMSVLGNDEQRKRADELVQQQRKSIQFQVAKVVVLKFLPQFHFVFDDSIQRGDKVLNILSELDAAGSKPNPS